MSTVAVVFRNRLIWVQGFALAVWLKEVLDSTEKKGLLNDPEWERRCLMMRLSATFPNAFHLHFDGDQTPKGESVSWSGEALGQLVELGEAANAALKAKGEIRYDEIRSWRLLDDNEIGGGVGVGGEEFFDPGRSAEAGDAVLALIRGTVPDEPPDAMWYYGDVGGRRTLPFASGTARVEVPEHLHSKLEQQLAERTLSRLHPVVHLKDGRSTQVLTLGRHGGTYVVLLGGPAGFETDDIDHISST